MAYIERHTLSPFVCLSSQIGPELPKTHIQTRIGSRHEELMQLLKFNFLTSKCI